VRLDLALIARHPELSRRRARDVIEKGQVTLAGDVVLEPGRDVPPEARLEWDPNRKARSRVRASLPLLYEDESVLVVDKPAGLLTVPTAPGCAQEDTALARVAEYVGRRRPQRPYVGVVHRIDRETSGAVAFALDPPTRKALRALFRRHEITRSYLALVSGSPPAESGTIDAPIHDGYVAGRRRLARPGEASKPALTRYRVIERFPGAALVEVELETGRQHQIRLHLAHVGLPILGDAVYAEAGAHAGLPVGRQLLHARRLAFVHPLNGRAVRAESPVPGDFMEALERLRRRAAARPPSPGGLRRPEAPQESGRARRARR
jgi:23S rRNA pseudouridine1911/1915/1917 synthase